jgi:hypothetical protein
MGAAGQCREEVKESAIDSGSDRVNVVGDKRGALKPWNGLWASLVSSSESEEHDE